MKTIINKGKYILLGLGIIIAYQSILPVIYFSIFQNLAKSENFWISNITYVFYYILTLIILIFIFRKSLKRELKKFKENFKVYIKKGLSCWGKGVLLMIISNLIIVSIAGNIAGNEEQNRIILTTYPLYAILGMCFIGPFIEELAFRKSFRGAFKNKYTFATFTALIFGGLHVLSAFTNDFTIANILNNWQQLLYIIPYGSLGFFFALAYYETDNIFTSTFVHICHNTITIILIILTSFVL